MTSTNRLNVQLLGAMDIARPDTGSIRPLLVQTKRSTLLAYLLMNTRAGYVNRDRVVGVFWPESSQDRARKSLNQALYELRKHIGGDVVLSVGEDLLGVDHDAIRCDAIEFQTAADAGALLDALSHYKGNFLDGVFLNGCAEFDRWREVEASRLEGRAVSLAWALAEVEAAEGHADGARYWCEWAAERAPDDESALMRHVRILDGIGDRTAATRVFEEFETRLKAEYGARPSPEACELLDQICRRDHAPDHIQPGSDSWGRRTVEPFVGLRPFNADDQHLFFGRKTESARLAAKVKQSRLVMVVGDSGCGKSSLVNAGLVPQYRGGAFAHTTDSDWENTIWHVIETRPRGNVFQALADDVGRASEEVGKSAADVGTFKKWIRSMDPEKVRDAIIGGSPSNACILIVVDQFEELFTQSEAGLRGSFIEGLLHLVGADAAPPIYVVMTMRRDYYNLCSDYVEFHQQLERRDEHGDQPAKFIVRRMDDTHLRECIIEPLKLAGVENISEPFVKQVLHDVGDQPGDLALLEMALTETWRRRNDFNGDLLSAYVSIGGVPGALATLASENFATLARDERLVAEAVFVRLVRLGDTGGTTRRSAKRDEFTSEAWSLVQKMASREFRRLVFVSGDNEEQMAELSHEALVTQWPQYQSWLQSAAGHKRMHDRLIPVAKRWNQSGRTDEGFLYTGRDLEEGTELLRFSEGWLSTTEKAFLEASVQSHERQQTQERKRAEIAREEAKKRERRSHIIAAAFAILAILSGVGMWYGWRQKTRAEEEQSRSEFVSSTLLGQYQRALYLADGLKASGVKLEVGALGVNAGELWVSLRDSLRPQDLLESMASNMATFVSSREAFAGMAFVLDDIAARHGDLRERATALRDRIRAAFIADFGLADIGVQNDPLNRQIWLEPGSFNMGDVRLTRLSVGFFIQEHEVTNAEYVRFDVEHNFPSGDSLHPVSEASWFDAMAYAAWLGGSLPTEAQWEYAARGQEGRSYPWSSEPPTCVRAQYDACDPSGTVEVMSKPGGATPDGIHDLAGNVIEWVGDWYVTQLDPADSLDPRGPASESDSRRVMRGGAHGLGTNFLHNSERSLDDPETKGTVRGFRVVFPASAGRN